MSDKIVSLRGGPVAIPDEPVNQELVADVRSLLERVESGDVNGIASVLSHPDNTVTWIMSGRSASYRILGAVHVVADEVLRGIKEDEDDD